MTFNVLGTVEECPQVTLTKTLNIWMKPEKFPLMPDGNVLIAVIDQRVVKKYILCKDFEDMQEVVQLYRLGYCFDIQWHHATIDILQVDPEIKIESI